MTCEGCASRRARLATWFRTLIGVEQALGRIVEGNRIRFQKLETRVDELNEAGVMLEHVITEGFKQTAISLEDHKGNINGLIKAGQENVERLGFLRDSMHNQREELRKVRDDINDQSNEMGRITESVMKLEFPGFQPVDLNLDG